MSPEELLHESVEIARRLCSASRDFETNGTAIAAEFDEPVDTIDLYHALVEAKRRGFIGGYFPGEMELPNHIRVS